MKTLYPVPPDPSTDPVYLTAAAVHRLIQPLPSGTAFCIGVVLIVMMTGRLVQTTGSPARPVLPLVLHPRWGRRGWGGGGGGGRRRGAPAPARAFLGRAGGWSGGRGPLNPVRLGTAQR